MRLFIRSPVWSYLVALALGILVLWLLVGTTGENVPGMLIMIGALVGWAVISDVVARKIWGRRIAGLLLAGLLSIFLIWWVSISRPVAVIPLSAGRHCKLQFHQWYSGRCVLSCYENGARIGTVRLATGLFTHPWAVFPGPSGKTVICFSWLDTTYAVFTVDVARPNPESVTIPEKLRDTVDASDFTVRAASRDEVAFVADFIRTAPADLSHLSRWGLASAESRENALLFLKLATSAYDSNDPVLKDARPQILPDGG